MPDDVRGPRESRDNAVTRALIERVARELAPNIKQARLLAAIAWPAQVERAFFDQGARELPEVTYEVDREAVAGRVARLADIERSIDGTDEVCAWLRQTVHSFVDGNRLLLAAGTDEFHRIAREMYGSARTRFLGDSARNIDLAEHLLARLATHGWDEARDPDQAPLSDAQFAAALRARVTSRTPPLEVEVELDEGCTAKVLAGMSRVRVRKGATFMPWEADNLWSHEVETHALTAQNGAAQPVAPFLRAGGPRSTRTQEGLAIFAEMYDHTLSIARMERLALRVKLVDMAEQGADFLELYRFLRERGAPERDAYLDAQRICRGGLVTGKAPFTKDACYLAGLLQVYTFLAALVRGGHRDEIEVLVAGRIALDDVPALVELRHRGILARPKYRPPWLINWRGLLPYFAFASFVSDVNLPPVEARFARVIELAAAQQPPAGEERAAGEGDGVGEGGAADD